MRGLILLLSLALVLPVAGADMTTLTIHVATQSGKPIDHASVIVKFVEGRSKVKFGKKIRTEYRAAHQRRRNRQDSTHSAGNHPGTSHRQGLSDLWTELRRGSRREDAGDHDESPAAAVHGALRGVGGLAL